jgi:hypothetical protein
MMISQVAAGDDISDEEDVLVVLKSVKHIDQEGVFKLTQELPFVYYRLDTFLLNDSALRHFFHGVLSFELLSFNFPHFSKASLSDDIVELEMCFVNAGAGSIFDWIKL